MLKEIEHFILLGIKYIILIFIVYNLGELLNNLDRETLLIILRILLGAIIVSIGLTYEIVREE